MKNTVTSTELEAIGQNWLTRRNKLLEYAQKIETPMDKSFRAWDLAHRLNRRIGKIIAILGQSDAPKNFAPGGLVTSIETMNPGEYVIARPKFKSK